MGKTAKDIMSSPVVTVLPDQNLMEAASIMLRERISTLVVVDHNGQVVGILTHSDFAVRLKLLPFSRSEVVEVLHRLASWGEMVKVYGEARGIKIKEVMSHPVFHVAPDMLVEEVARAMAQRGFHRAPVMENERLVGIVSRHDFLKLLLDLPLEEEAKQPR